MRHLRRNWADCGGAIALAGLAIFAVYVCVSAWGQTAPGLSIMVTPTNVVSLTVTNGATNGRYQIYTTEFLNSPFFPWTLLTNGSTGQTNFTTTMGNFDQGFFKAVNNTNSVPFSISIIIQSPTNGALVY